VEANAAVEALGALAQESRLAVFRLLVRQGPGGMPAGRVAEALGIPPATLSFHLAQLGHAGLVLSRRDGRRIIYSADYDAMQELMAFLTEKCCQPAPRGGRARKC
jgi:ArsR family transcriptional regulator, arsenate/arsenite/antimonite-responsive transcriptional repressor